MTPNLRPYDTNKYASENTGYYCVFNLVKLEVMDSFVIILSKSYVALTIDSLLRTAQNSDIGQFYSS